MLPYDVALIVAEGGVLIVAEQDGLFEVHHIRRLADLDRPGHTERMIWVKRVVMSIRKAKVAWWRIFHCSVVEHVIWRRSANNQRNFSQRN